MTTEPEAAPIETTPAQEPPTLEKEDETMGGNGAGEEKALKFTEEEMRGLKLKDGVDVQGEDDRWAAATVTAIDDGGVKIHFTGFTSKYDLMIKWADHERLAPPWSIVWKGTKKNPPTKKKKATGGKGKPAKKAKKAVEEPPEEEPTEEDLEEKIWVASPEGETFQLEGPMSTFCKQHDISAAAMAKMLKENNPDDGKVMKDYEGWKCWRSNRKSAEVLSAKAKNGSTLNDIHERMQSQHVMKEYPVTRVHYRGSLWERRDGKLVLVGGAPKW